MTDTYFCIVMIESRPAKRDLRYAKMFSIFLGFLMTYVLSTITNLR